jgi:hypothetical protein
MKFRILFFFAFFVFFMGEAAYSIDFDRVVGDLRRQKVRAESLVAAVKKSFDGTNDEYVKAKELYNSAKNRHDNFVEEILYDLKHGGGESVVSSGKTANESADKFEKYVNKIVPATVSGKITIPIAAFFLDVAEKISKEIRAWRELVGRKKAKRIEDTKALLEWKVWEDID